MDLFKSHIKFTHLFLLLLITLILNKAEAAVEDINFYGKVVDQYGEPVSGVKVKFKARSQFLSAGTGYGEVTTDDEGLFNTRGVEGVGLSINELIKFGYQFEGRYRFDNFEKFERSVLWENYTKDNPYIFKLWKIESYPNVIKEKRIGFGFTPDGRASTIDISSGQKALLKKGIKQGDFTVSFLQDGDDWFFRLEMLNGGLKETNDLYLNLAPESGYNQFVEYKFPENHTLTSTKKYYIKLQCGDYYGQMILQYKPDYQDKSAIFFSYVINADGGRSLVVKE